MANRNLRLKSIKLRLLGKTYSEIKRELNIPKSTLSYWLSSYPLTEQQILKLESSIIRNKDLSREKYRETMRKKREGRLGNTYKKMADLYLPLTKKEIIIAGLFLYWGEGEKRINGAVALSNTDPNVIRFGLYWLTQALEIPIEKINVFLHLYDDMNIDLEMGFWEKMLGIEKVKFKKPYIKKSSRQTIDHKGFGHGTCNLVINDVLLKEKIMMSIKAISDFYCSNTIIRL